MKPDVRLAKTSRGDITFLEAGHGPALVLLHGIGSGAGSWIGQIGAFSGRYRVIAWNAPGYGGSAALDPEVPGARDYASSLAALLDALDIRECHLVGHSLGAMMACAFVRANPERVLTLLIADPAAGYGASSPELREEKRKGRLEPLARLGPEGLARERHGVLLSRDAPHGARELVRSQMAAIHPDGYRQAVEMLMHGDIRADIRDITIPATVAAGGADTVTPPEGCREVADCFRSARFVLLPGLGHACYVENPDAFNKVLRKHLEAGA